MFRLTIILFLLIPQQNIFAKQSTDSADVKDVFRASVVNAGFDYEKRVGKLQTVIGQGRLTGFVLGITGGRNISTIYIEPSLALKYRYYYNHKRRVRKGKRIDLNSMNYLSPGITTLFYSRKIIPTVETIPDPYRFIPFHAITAEYGIQRNYKSRFSLDWSIGIGYRTRFFARNEKFVLPLIKRSGELIPVSNLTLGVWLNRRGKLKE